MAVAAVLRYAAIRLAPARVAGIGEDARWSALLAATMHFAGLGQDYFERRRETSPLQHYWSLGVEERFYLRGRR